MTGQENAQVGILMGSDSDLEVMRKAADILDEFSIPFEMRVSSAHRDPTGTTEYAASASDRGIQVLICGAGMAAHLAGVVAAHTTLPVIGVPLASGKLQGLDALYATVQMPPGIPVATVAVDGGRNAGILAIQILSIGNKKLQDKMTSFKRKLCEQNREKNKALE